jgi:hypothetical protein
VLVGAPDGALTASAGLAAVSELCGRLGVIGAIDAATGAIKQRDRGFSAGELLTGIAAAAEHWYRHRTTVESIFRDSKHGAALRHLPSGHPRVNLAWMWGALLAATMAAWLHQLTAVTAGQDILAGHGVRGGKAMIATLRWRLIRTPGRLVRHAGQLILRLPPGHCLLAEILARLRALPATP